MSNCVRMTIAELQEKLDPFVGKKITQPRTSNKGEVGILLEKLTGIPQSSACLDCVDGELKVFPVKRTAKKLLVPKETIAVTMLNRDDLRANTFNLSTAYTKLKRTLYVPYERIGSEVIYMKPTLIDLQENIELLTKLASDYDLIREKFSRGLPLSSRDGILLQNRTKGRGHGSTSRAFYLRTGFAKSYISF